MCEAVNRRHQYTPHSSKQTHNEIPNTVHDFSNKYLSGRVHETVPEGAEEEACLRIEAATQELKAEGNSDQEAVPRHLQDTDQAVQGT